MTPEMTNKRKSRNPDLAATSSSDLVARPENDRKFVEALSRGLEVLRAFGQGAAILGNQDLARITGLPKPTISRMTYTLTKLGYLSYNPVLEKYQLSSGVLALGYAYVSNLKVRQLARPYMDEFARQTNMFVGLTCRDRLHMIFVENRMPPEAWLLRMEVGVRMPITTTSAGRCYFAALPDNERELLRLSLEKKYAERWPDMDVSLQNAISEYEEKGFCISAGEWDRSINSASVPIHLEDGTIMTLTCSAPSYLVTAEMLNDSIAHRLAMLAGDIESLGV